MAQGKLGEFRKGLAAWMARPGMSAAIGLMTAELWNSGALNGAVKAGDTAPSFRLADAHGKNHSLWTLLGRGPVILSFVPGQWCPATAVELATLEQSRGAVEAAGAHIMAISMQDTVHALESAEEAGIGFPLLTDHGGAVALRFGLRWTLPDTLQETFKQLELDVPAANSDSSWTIALNTRLVVSRTGVVFYTEVTPDLTNRHDMSELMPIVEHLCRADSR